MEKTPLKGDRKKAKTAKAKPDRAAARVRKRRRRILKRVLGRTALYIGTVLLVSVLGLCALLNVVFRGPQRAADELTLMLMESSAGKYVPPLFYSEEEIAAINGGAFSDPQGQGNGGMPAGNVITEGRTTNARGGADLITVGFDRNDVLIVGKMSRTRAEELGIRDCCGFGPALVINGEAAKITGSGSGLNPRTAIGQRADGAVLMLVIDGRQVNSPGASMADLVEVMLRYGAVNACNLDGGSSSNIYYNGEILNDGVAIIGARPIPTAFVVR